MNGSREALASYIAGGLQGVLPYHGQMRWSERTSWEIDGSGWSDAVSAAAASVGLLDLTVSNPTAAGLAYPADLLAPLRAAEALRYQPAACGSDTARQAICGYYADAGARIDIADTLLTASTSEAYSYLFSLLCDPGDEVLIAQPSYPLFDLLARLGSVRLVEYPLLYHDGWRMDLHALAARITPRTRAVVVVHPNNPTGNFASDDERRELQRICARHEMALIVDEVFLDYAWGASRDASRSFAAEPGEALQFVLSGISKVCALPQMKCSWMVAGGPMALRRAAMDRLETIADTFLSVSGPVQYALPTWLASRGTVQAAIRQRAITNLATLDEFAAHLDANRLRVDGGWTAVLRVPRTVEDVAWEIWALQHGVLVQPGSFYGLPAGRVVISLLTPSAVLREALERLAAAANAATARVATAKDRP